jgi:hypothetical protein
VDEGGAVVVGWFVELGEAFAEQVGGAAEGPAGCAVDEQVVAGDVEGRGEFDDGFDG